MTDAIKLEIFDPRAVGRMIDTFHRAEMADRKAAWESFGDCHGHTVERRSHPVHTFRLATQSILVAFDEDNKTLYIGEPNIGPGYVYAEAQRAAQSGDMNPYLREVRMADDDRHYAREAEAAAKAERDRHASVVADATSRLKSPKPGVRRRAKRLLEKLGRP